jgi:poly-gamma-glutamate synthesis protein (capsule biosynthesis protein)
MVGRGIDQILPYPADPVLHEEAVRSAITYVDLAGAAHWPIPRKAAAELAPISTGHPA